MNLSPTAQATLLMTSYFGKASKTDAKPLTNVEWGRFALWLRDHEITPAELLVPEPKKLLAGWQDTKINLERIVQLLNRGHSLALAVEKWQRAGLWIITRADPEYPTRLKTHLKTGSPPVLFGCGNKRLLDKGGLAVIGSRNANDEDIFFTQQIGMKAANGGVTIVSGGARGVDEAAMLGAMDAGGNVVGIVADGLLKAATSSKWRKGLMEGQIVLISPFYPEAGFNVGNAMARNKYIYCLADSSLVIHSGMKGGTLTGAKENLKKHWVPLWVKPTQDKNSANKALVQNGGQWCEGNIHALDLKTLLLPHAPTQGVEQVLQIDMFSSSKEFDGGQQVTAHLSQDTVSLLPSEDTGKKRKNTEAVSSTSKDDTKKPVDFYEIFLGEIVTLAASHVTSEEIAKHTGLTKIQINAWLKCAIDDGIVKKFNRPVRYQYVEGDLEPK